MADIRQTMRSVAYDLWRVPTPEKQPAEAPAAAPAFEDIWKAVDECTDWTELLAEPARNPELSRLAADILAGDAAAYRTALEKLAPIADLAAYAAECTVEIVSADVLAVSYTAAFAADDRRRACGLALRVARDLLAALPVTAVQLRAGHADGAVLEAKFTRDALRGIRVNVADPEAIAAQCGQWV